MSGFKYINQDYVPSVDLTTLGNTFNTLEQGHKEAVKAASDLRTTVANLDMDASEDGFKESLINEIQTAVENNTIYGNSYGALDDIITKAGDIASDGRVIGRLRNNAAKKEYDKKVDAMAIPEGMKEMYKEENPYYYEDGKVDEKTGRVLPGKRWEATTNPVKTVSDAEIQKYALTIAAKESGSGQVVSFLDANGQPTLDPTKSEDGSMYKKVGSKWERLTEDKIAKAYNVAINSIPGAKDSINQDYKYERWKYNKAVEQAKQNGEDETPYVAGFTDKNGNIYTQEQWLNNKINNFSDVAAYNRVDTTVDYGTALEKRYARQQQAAAIANAIGGAGGASADLDKGFGTMILGTKEVEGNAFSGAVQTKSVANAQGLSIVKKIMGKDAAKFDSISDVISFVRENNKGTSFGPNIAAQYIINKYGKDLDKNEKLQLINSFTGYVRANMQIQEMYKKAGDKADGLRFGENLSKQEFTKDNEYGRKIIDNLNTLYKDGENVEFKIGSQILNGIAAKYDTDIKGLKKLGINIDMMDDGNFTVSIDKDHRMLIPKFAHTLFEVDEEIPGTIGGFFKNVFTTNVADTNYQVKGKYYADPEVHVHSILDSINYTYTKGLESSKKANLKAGVAKGTIIYNGLDDGSFTSLWLREQGETLGYTPSELLAQQKAANERVDRMFSATNFDSGRIEYIDPTGKTTTNLSNNQDAKILIQKMYSNDTWKNQVKRSCVVPTGGATGQPLGYVVSFTVPEGAETGNFKTGQKCTFVVSGIMEEEANYNPSMNPNILAGNVMLTSNATGGTIDNLGYDSNLGDTRIIPNRDGSYNTSIFGNKTKLNETQATDLTAILYRLETIKSCFEAGMFTNDPNSVIQVNNNLDVLSAKIGDIIGKNSNDIKMSIANYILDNE